MQEPTVKSRGSEQDRLVVRAAMAVRVFVGAALLHVGLLMWILLREGRSYSESDAGENMLSFALAHLVIGVVVAVAICALKGLCGAALVGVLASWIGAAVTCIVWYNGVDDALCRDGLDNCRIDDFATNVSNGLPAIVVAVTTAAVVAGAVAVVRHRSPDIER